ncbi:DUF308 domain-containing protein [Nesterenkonia muleiensis]|uniref:DUF308 domain-containing protein n=1 Tax=Nesterenkonia muleiensis TaxID=2282648 RepID=UPI000E7156BB|nr:DUF308 domain-containing protein [Nesterenkonia muleiensis]
MTWLEPDTKNTKKEDGSMAKKFFTACLLILLGLVALAWAVEIAIALAPWIIGAAVICGGIYWLIRAHNARRGRW